MWSSTKMYTTERSCCLSVKRFLCDERWCPRQPGHQFQYLGFLLFEYVAVGVVLLVPIGSTIRVVKEQLRSISQGSRCEGSRKCHDGVPCVCYSLTRAPFTTCRRIFGTHILFG